MSKIQLRTTFIEAVVAWNGCVICIRLDVVTRPLDISIFDRVRPCVCQLGRDAMRQTFIKLYSQPVVPGVPAVLDLQYSAVTRVNSVRGDPHRGGVRANLITVSVINSISHCRTGRAQVQITLGNHTDAAAPNIAHG